MSLDDILEQFANKCRTSAPDFYYAKGMKFFTEDEAKAQIKKDLLELVGEDEEVPPPRDDESRDRFYRKSGQNFTKNQIRQKIEEYCK